MTSLEAKFKDGCAKSYNEKELLDTMVIQKKATEAQQLGYIFVSNLWTSSGGQMGPSEHRSIADRPTMR